MEKDGVEWLPVVELDGIEFVVDFANRAFRQHCDPNSSVCFHSEHGRDMVQAMVGTAWRTFTPREVWEKAGMV